MGGEGRGDSPVHFFHFQDFRPSFLMIQKKGKGGGKRWGKERRGGGGD